MAEREVNNSKGLVKINIDKLIPYENNPRNNEAAVDKVAESIKEFGFKVPIIIDKDNVIIAGHIRLKAAQKLGLKDVPVIVADDLTPEQVKAFRLADNKVSEFSSWDEEKLHAELMELQTMSFNVESFGFETTEIKEADDFDDLFEEEEIELPREEIGTGQTGNYMTFGDKRVPMTQDELEKLIAFYNKYVDDHGNNMGFVYHLLGE